MPSKLLIANWKMNPARESDAVRIAKASDAKHVVICPPFPHLGAVRAAVSEARLGAQDVFWEDQGAYTGEVSPRQLVNAGVRWVIIGHSERRTLFGETDEIVHKKITAAMRVLLKAVVCVGEPGDVRRHGHAEAKRFVARQLKGALRTLDFRVTIAYEPVWAIGTGTPDNPAETAEMAAHIKEVIQGMAGYEPKVLYGGSVNAKNAAGFFARAEIDGALVGGASVRPDEFKSVMRIAAGRKQQ